MNASEILREIFETSFAKLDAIKSRSATDELDERNCVISELNEAIKNDLRLDDDLLIESLKSRMEDYEESPEPQGWQWITSLVSVIFHRGESLEELYDVLVSHFNSDSNIDNEYICDWLVRLGNPKALQMFLVINACHENHYLIEKIIRELSFANWDVGGIILMFLNHQSGFVRDASVDYLDKMDLSQYYDSLRMMIEVEPDEDFRIILKGVKLLIRWDRREDAKKIIDSYVGKIGKYRKEYQEQADVRAFKEAIEDIGSSL